MKNSTKIIATIISIVTLVLQSPSVQHYLGNLLTSHPNVAAIVAGIAAILSLVHNPTNGGTNGQAPSN